MPQLSYLKYSLPASSIWKYIYNDSSSTFYSNFAVILLIGNNFIFHVQSWWFSQKWYYIQSKPQILIFLLGQRSCRCLSSGTQHIPYRHYQFEKVFIVIPRQPSIQILQWHFQSEIISCSMFEVNVSVKNDIA